MTVQTRHGTAWVSIITPLHNAETYIADTLSSVLAQTFADWELIIVDDCSEDTSIEIVSRYAEQDDRIKLIRLEQNSGAAVARNSGIEMASGRYIAFLDSDDLWLPEKLAQQIRFMQSHNVAFSYSQVERMNAAGESLGVGRIPDKVCYHQLLKTNVIVCSSAMYDTEKLGKVFMPAIRKRQDFALWLQLLKKTPFAYGLQQPLVKYVVRPGSVSANKRSAAAYTWRVYRKVEKLSLLRSLFYFSHYASNAFIRIKMPWLARRLGWSI